MREYLQIIQSSGAMLLNVINEILDFSKIESSEVHLERLPTVLDDLLENLAGHLPDAGTGQVADAHMVTDGAVPAANLQRPDALPPDPDEPAQQRAKFTSEGSVTITIALDEDQPQAAVFGR